MNNFREYLERNGHDVLENIPTDQLPNILLDYYTSVRKMETVQTVDDDDENSSTTPNFDGDCQVFD